ncbi:unnamed protein product [Auanema sp. JU1783]|nr:unnamed protein product [Auanema sp. JU1783]
MASTAVYMCTHLGLLSVILNLFVIVALVRNRRRVLMNVFYVIVLHCAILDVARGSCLVIYGLPSLVQSVYKMMDSTLQLTTNVILFRASAFALVILRICNLLTIFNLLVFTLNEFIVITYPLHYRRYFRRRVVLVILCCCWIVSIIMGMGLLFPKSSLNLATSSDDIWHIDVATLSMLTISVLCVLVLFAVMVCYGFILRTIRKFKDENGSMNTEDSHRHNNGSNRVHRTINGTSSNCSNGASNGSRSRKFKLQAVQRHKYIYVIGSVLMVDLLFLCPYSGIQIVSFLHINGFLQITHSSTFIRWWLQVLIGVHSVCQPLCYFRMTEFRRLACCGSRKQWNRSKSYSQLNRSFANTRSVNRDEEEQKEEDATTMFPEDTMLLKEGQRTPLSSDRSRSPTVGHNWSRAESVRFRTYGNDYAQPVKVVNAGPTPPSRASSTTSDKTATVDILEMKEFG